MFIGTITIITHPFFESLSGSDHLDMGKSIGGDKGGVHGPRRFCFKITFILKKILAIFHIPLPKKLFFFSTMAAPSHIS